MEAATQQEAFWPSGHEMIAPITGFEPVVVNPAIDLYERIRALESSNRALEHFAGDASHDLREPIRIMSLLAERLAANGLDEEGRRLLAGITDGLDRMRTLIGDLLEYSRVGGQPSERSAVNCESVLKETLDLLEETIAEKCATVTYGRLPVIDAHRCRLGQVFQNLISNALKFAREGSPLRVHVAAVRQDNGWCFTVRDNGIGIDPDMVAEVFEPFRRLHPRDAYAGTGIGLSICKRIIAHYGGRIWVQPGHDGGSAFCFTVPDYSTSPLRIASATAAARSETPSFW
jgi:signal transduction histidine kinase